MVDPLAQYVKNGTLSYLRIETRHPGTPASLARGGFLGAENVRFSDRSADEPPAGRISNIKYYITFSLGGTGRKSRISPVGQAELHCVQMCHRRDSPPSSSAFSTSYSRQGKDSTRTPLTRGPPGSDDNSTQPLQRGVLSKKKRKVAEASLGYGKQKMLWRCALLEAVLSYVQVGGLPGLAEFNIIMIPAGLRFQQLFYSKGNTHAW